jgi:hypothetical protein
MPAAAGGATAHRAATTRTATDHLSGLRFALKGRQLTLRLMAKSASKSQAAGPKLRGRQVSVACGASTSAVTPNSAAVARGGGRWGAKATVRRFALSRNLGSRARWCLVQNGSSIVGYVDLRLGHNPAER